MLEFYEFSDLRLIPLFGFSPTFFRSCHKAFPQGCRAPCSRYICLRQAQFRFASSYSATGAKT